MAIRARPHGTRRERCGFVCADSAMPYLPRPNGWRVSGEARREAEGRVRCTRGLGRSTLGPILSCANLDGETIPERDPNKCVVALEWAKVKDLCASLLLD